MATQVTPDVEILAPESVEIVELDGVVEIAAPKPVSDLEATVTGDKPVAVAGPKVSDSTITASAGAGKTAQVVVSTKNFKKSTVTTDKGTLDLSVNTGSFKKSTIEGGKKADSVAFGNQTKVNKADIDLGKGSDTVVFKSGVKFQGKTSVDLGSGGKDVIEFESAPKSGKITIENFDKKDKLVVGDTTYTYEDLKGGAEVKGIKVEFND